MTPTSFLFKDSEYDFDDVLKLKGYELKFDREDVVMFSKNIIVENEFSEKHKSKFEMAIPFSIDVQRPKMLNINGKYDLCSPYLIVCNYYPQPLYCNRQISWAVFPGHDKRILEAMLNIVEDEAKAMFKECMKTDITLAKI